MSVCNGRIVFGTGFGLSTNFWFALTMRFLLGSFNGILATAKVIILYSTTGILELLSCNIIYVSIPVNIGL